MHRRGLEGRVVDLDGGEPLGVGLLGRGDGRVRWDEEVSARAQRKVDLERSRIDTEYAIGLERCCERREREVDRGGEQKRTGAEASVAANGFECKACARSSRCTPCRDCAASGRTAAGRCQCARAQSGDVQRRGRSERRCTWSAALARRWMYSGVSSLRVR
eukprot:6206939-Pleurochrysis_carterae.AAC.2